MIHTVLAFRKPFPGLSCQANLPNTHTQVRVTKRRDQESRDSDLGIKHLVCQWPQLGVKIDRNDNNQRNFDKIKYQIGKVS